MPWLDRVFQTMARGSSRPPSQVRLPPGRVDSTPPQNLIVDQDYFVVTVHELYLEYERTLWRGFVPSVWASAEFLYDGQTREVPFVLGPGMLGAGTPNAGAGMLFRNARVVGPVPYKGGPISLSIVLSRVAAGDAADRLLTVIESAASAFNVTTALGPYLAVGKTLVAGVESLLGLGSSPLIGVQDTMSFDVATTQTGHFALIDEVPQTPLWVRENALHTGLTRESARPVRNANYVLYSLLALPRDTGRNDVYSLGRIREDVRRIEEFAGRPDDLSFDAAKALLIDLSVRLRYHPDLTIAQADKIYQALAAGLRPAHDAAVELAHRGAPEEELSAQAQQIRAIAAQVLNL